MRNAECGMLNEEWGLGIGDCVSCLTVPRQKKWNDY
jgi:hypothetical protein